jgi:hypothetical protein
MPKAPKPALTAEFVRSILDYDPNTGVFRWRVRADRAKNWNTRNAGKVAGTTHPDGYILIQIEKGAHYGAHVLAWLYMMGEWRPGGVDHLHGLRGDNRFSELRAATSVDNGCNKTMQKNNRTGIIGVWFNMQRGKWEASISRDGRRVWRKFFPTLEDAASARHSALAEIHGEFAVSDHLTRPLYHHRRDH